MSPGALDGSLGRVPKGHEWQTGEILVKQTTRWLHVRWNRVGITGNLRVTRNHSTAKQ